MRAGICGLVGRSRWRADDTDACYVDDCSGRGQCSGDGGRNFHWRSLLHRVYRSSAASLRDDTNCITSGESAEGVCASVVLSARSREASFSFLEPGSVPGPAAVSGASTCAMQWRYRVVSAPSYELAPRRKVNHEGSLDDSIEGLRGVAAVAAKRLHHHLLYRASIEPAGASRPPGTSACGSRTHQKRPDRWGDTMFCGAQFTASALSQQTFSPTAAGPATLHRGERPKPRSHRPVVTTNLPRTCVCASAL
jgi:hypothetical protein